MTDEDLEDLKFLCKISNLVNSKPELFHRVIAAATRGMESRISDMNTRLMDLETCYLQHVAVSLYGNGGSGPTYKTAADKLRSVKDYLHFRWDHIIEIMENAPQKLTKKKKGA